MKNIIGVRFKKAGKIYNFDSIDLDIKEGDFVIVETSRGIEFGQVVRGIKSAEENSFNPPLKRVIRVADDNDKERRKENIQMARKALEVCKEEVLNLKLDMKLVESEYTFDRNKLLFYFTADGRIDFRELVKKLASIFKTRIELRQIGVRDEVKIKNGIARCGRPLCCATHMEKFVPVSIKMAKNQRLSLNPSKISGICGKLMCCLKFEEEVYKELRKGIPKLGSMVGLPTGEEGEVKNINILKQSVRVLIRKDDNVDMQTYKIEDLKYTDVYERACDHDCPHKQDDDDQDDQDGDFIVEADIDIEELDLLLDEEE